MSKSSLFENFEATSAKQWKQKIQFDLQGKDFNDNLVWKSSEGIDVKPFYHSETYSKAPDIPYNSSDWKIGHSIYVHSIEKSNAHAIELIQNGVESLYFILPNERLEIEALLKNIDLSQIRLYFEALFLSDKLAAKLKAYAAAKKTSFYILNDPIGQLAKSGNWHKSMKIDIDILSKILRTGQPLEGVVSVDLGLYQNAGASITQQLAYTLAHVNEYLNLFDGKTLKSIVFKTSIGSNYFFEIAKLQALRLLWQSLTMDYGVAINSHIVSQPSRRNKTIYDYNTNLMRTTTECMSAVLGSTDTVINMPYDHLYHKDNAFGDRLSRNQLLILKNESYFNAVSNPTEGAYYIETLTKELAEKALELFKNIENKGGFLKQLKEGNIQRKIKEQALKEQQQYDKGVEGLLGTHFQQNTSDIMKFELELYPFLKQQSRKTLVEPIIPKRIAEAEEQKRLENE
tara:strand:+ start:11866 stop:13236 length:1371 start_codon:yes stop_codon:yes gene_type:complete